MVDPGVLAGAARETRALMNQCRRSRRALKRLEDQIPELPGRVLGTYVLQPGEPLDGEVLDFLRLAVAEHQQEIHIQVTAPRGREEPPDGQEAVQR